MSRPRIAFVGAGSTVFAKNLLGDILSFPELAGADIRLFDINQERLDVTGQVARRVRLPHWQWAGAAAGMAEAALWA